MKSIMILIFLFLFAKATAPEFYGIIMPVPEPLYKGFSNYADDLGFRESGNNPKAINKYGCFAEHQWKESTLAHLGYKEITLKRFRKDPGIFPRTLQIEALKALIDTNKVWLGPYESYIGRTIKGIPITQSGLIAAAHLGGFNSVRLFLITNGRTNKRDQYGTSVGSYIKAFQGYRL